MKVKIISNSKDVSRAFARKARAMGNARSLLQDVATTVRIEMSDNFNAGGMKLDTPWSPLKKSTQKQRERLGYGAKGPILVRTGKLKKSIKIDHVNNREAEIGSYRVDYVKWHQSGTRNMPSRKIIGIGKNGMRLISGLLEKWLRKVVYS